jgi:hypothetical protein
LDPSVNPAECVCDQRLGNVEGTLPPGMKLVAACNLRWGSGAPIDLNKEVVSLDTYTDGQVPEGTYVLAGQQVILGRVVLTNQPDLPDVILQLSPYRDCPKNRISETHYPQDSSAA